MFDASPIEPKASIAEIKTALCARYNLTKDQLVSKCRSRELAWPRQLGYWLAKEMTIASYPMIARHFGKLDHVTVMFGVRKIDRLLPDNPALQIAVSELMAHVRVLIGERPPAIALPMEADPKPVTRRPRKKLSTPSRVSALDRDAWVHIGGEVVA